MTHSVLRTPEVYRQIPNLVRRSQSTKSQEEIWIEHRKMQRVDGIVHTALSVGLAAKQEVTLLMCSWTLKPFAERKRCVKEGSHESWLLETLFHTDAQSFQEDNCSKMPAVRETSQIQDLNHCWNFDRIGIHCELQNSCEFRPTDRPPAELLDDASQSRWNKQERTILLAGRGAVGNTLTDVVRRRACPSSSEVPIVFLRRKA